MSIASEISRLQTAKASLKSSIEAKGVTVSSSAKLDDYYVFVDNISGGSGGSGASVALGSFTGDGTRNASLVIPFAPDIIIIGCDLDYTVAGWIGTKDVVIIKNVMTLHGRHNNNTQENASGTVYFTNEGIDPPYGATTNSYGAYGAYSNGVFTVSNQTSNALTSFILNQEYTWKAIGYQT